MIQVSKQYVEVAHDDPPVPVVFERGGSDTLVIQELGWPTKVYFASHHLDLSEDANRRKVANRQGSDSIVLTESQASPRQLSDRLRITESLIWLTPTGIKIGHDRLRITETVVASADSQPPADDSLEIKESATWFIVRADT